ncbi:maltokinase N-terminal cap-like domain-containing protein [Streptomyces palmae]|uniref:1,4-alpha-glucan branching protein n=1 Tax=Streptomyces palmae TaxID=1701085 RepID=A0A4Z0FKD5_9ACTN|nr:1,4-alpha-glucan branching protein [Streptomyces palmae]TGA83144.1 1,4-alpha-glucan branching protein [Streptomyces palmae]
MSVIHHTTLKPTKLELLTSWLPTRPWYRGGAEPELARVGGFRLDDPEGEVGIELMVVADTSGAEPVHYLVPLTYRGAPLDGAEQGLVGTMEHGVLGPRWVYDGAHDPVLLAQLLALLEGRVEPQMQSVSDTVDHEVRHSYTGTGPIALDPAATTATDDHDGTELRTAEGGPALRLSRVLQAAANGEPTLPEGAIGQVTGHWRPSEDTLARGLFAVLHAAPKA